MSPEGSGVGIFVDPKSGGIWYFTGSYWGYIVIFFVIGSDWYVTVGLNTWVYYSTITRKPPSSPTQLRDFEGI